MGVVEYAARGLLREIDKRTQEFYEFVMPAIDMYEDGNDLVVEIDLPGFRKEDISLKIIEGNVLSIKATRKLAKEVEKEAIGLVHYIQRPIRIDKRILLPTSTNKIERAIETAKYVDGVVTLKIQIPKAATIPIT